MAKDFDKTILVLDYDGTLHDSRVVYEPAFRRCMDEITELGWIEPAKYSSEEINYWVGFSAKEMWEKFHPELTQEQKEDAGRRIGKYMLEAIFAGEGRLYSGTFEALEELAKDYELMFFSNADRAYVDAHRRAFGLERWIREFYCTGDYGFAQKEEVFSRHIYIPGRSYIAVGDRIKDIQLAKACGLKSIGCLYGFGTPEELAGADKLIFDICELKAAADELKAAAVSFCEL